MVWWERITAGEGTAKMSGIIIVQLVRNCLIKHYCLLAVASAVNIALSELG